MLANLDGNAAMDELNAAGCLTVEVEGVKESLSEEDLLIDAAQMEGYISNSDYGITVVLDTNLTPELIEEGYVREVISKVQTMRKDTGFEVMDHIAVYVSGNDTISKVVHKNEEEIRRVVLADEIVYDQTAENSETGASKEWNLNGEDVVLGVKKI